MKSNPGHISLLLDCSNAFGTVRRNAMLEGAIKCGAHKLLSPLRAMYSGESVGYVALANGTHAKVSISRGVRQGDSAGPALFGVALIPILEECRSDHP